jgi:hypothetical protein
MKRFLIGAAILIAMPIGAHAAVITIIDSGTDLNHPQLSGKGWVNDADPDDAIDNDDNLLIDDTHGWNFADNNNKLYDKKLKGTFSQDVYTFFDVQLRFLMGTATQADSDWMNAHRSDAKFITELETFANWVHGTHVAGLTAKDAKQAQVMPLKIIPTQAAFLLNRPEVKVLRMLEQKSDLRDKLIRMALKALAQQGAKVFEQVGNYVSAHGTQVANCSFGSSVPALKPTLGPILKVLLGHQPSDAELNDYLGYFITETMAATQPVLIDVSPGTLFVIAAGNDGSNNDDLPASPANIKADNTLTVAASMGVDKLASFSNFGEGHVDVAAPGVGIESSIPGDTTLRVSGTSQAAPFVANIAGKVLDANPSLTPAQVKQIIVGTVDAKDWLKGKVASAGTANPDRAFVAAQLSTSQSIEQAITNSQAQVGEWKPSGAKPKSNGYVMPLMPLVR